MIRKLTESRQGASFRLHGIQGGSRAVKRLEELGILSDSVIGLVKNDSSGPVIVRVRGANIVIGRGLADQILVEEIPEKRDAESNREFRVAIVGQPNSGKTSLFNRLTGSAQQVGNWPGVTVEKKEGRLYRDGMKILIMDVPGIYSMSCYSMEEKITRDCLMKDPPDLIVNIADANNLERQLYLSVQLALMDIPMILVLNMMDEVEERGLSVDVKRLAELFGVPVYPIVARENKGVRELLDGVAAHLREPSVSRGPLLPPGELLSALDAMAAKIRAVDPDLAPFARWYALKLLEKDPLVEEKISSRFPGLMNDASEGLESLSVLQKKNRDQVVPEWIYGITRGIEGEVVREFMKKKSVREIISNFLDLIVLDKIFGVPVFLAVMFLLFQATFTLGGLLSGWMKTGLDALAALSHVIPHTLAASLVENGIIGGVGNVLLLIPYLLVLFLLMTLLEDSGYMSRAAFVMDRFMHRIGLHGKSFIPLVLGFGCNVPAIMAARTLERQEEKIKTVLMVPFMSCSGRVPVYVLFASAFFGAAGSFVVFGLYLFGVLAGILTGLILQKTALRKRSEGLIMELPPYRLPGLSNTLLTTWVRLREYIVKAGTVIFGLSVVLWALSYFPAGVQYGGPESLIGQVGKVVGLALAPLGFDWRMSVALLTGFIAKEVVLSTLGVLYGGADLAASLVASMTPGVALSYLVFILLYTPCVATVAVMRTETNSWKWTLFSVGYGLVLAWGLSFAVTNVGRLFF